MASFFCPICLTNRKFVNFAQMFRHISFYHQNDANFAVTCDLRDTCGVMYRTFSGYKSHIYRQHANELYSMKRHENNTNVIPINTQQQEQVDSSGEHILGTGDEDDEFDYVNDDPETLLHADDYELVFSEPAPLSLNSMDGDAQMFDSLVDIKRAYVAFILQLREEFILPKNMMTVISTYIITLLNRIECFLEKKAVKYSTDSSTGHRDSEVIYLHQLKDTFDDICDGMESMNKNEYQFIKNCEKYFQYSPPEEIILSLPGEDLERGYFVPIDKTLQSMLRAQPFLFRMLENVQTQQTASENDPDLMFSIRDSFHGGRLDPDTLLIQLYVDDIGLTNPIGSKRDQHKLSMVYFSIEDVPAQFRSKTDLIQLVAICDSKILKDDAKAKRFFKPIVDSLNRTQLDGLSINGIRLKFSFSTMVADNLAAHLIGGFQMCFNTGHFCRRCYINYDQKKSLVSLTKIKRRTASDHDALVAEVLHNPHRSPLMGVTGQSPLIDLIGFHPTTSLPGDMMHDFLEGVCPMVIMSLLKQASSMRLLTHARIQQRMNTFKYGYFDSKNQPPPIQVKNIQNDRIMATASQKLCLFKLFPIIFYDITSQLPSFIVYKILREILDLVLSYPFRKTWLPVLTDLCEKLHETMLEHFPNRIVPKLHFLREYERIVYDYGPPVKQWCFRYEACHAYFKKISARTNNFKNISKTLATRYLLRQCFKFAHLARLKALSYSIGIKTVQNNEFNSSMKKILFSHFGDINLCERLKQCRRLIHENVEYCQSSIYVLDLATADEIPVFFQIIFILKSNEKWWLLVDILDTVSYDEELFAWQVKSIDHYSMLNPCELRYYHKGLDVYEVNSSSFVSLTNRLTSY